MSDKDDKQNTPNLTKQETPRFPAEQEVRQEPVAIATPHLSHNGKPIEFTTSKNLSNQAWLDEAEQHRHRPWNATAQGRLTIRLFSRGVMGAGFYALGNYYAKNALREYHPDKAPTKAIHYIVRGIDTFAAKPIEKAALMLGMEEKAARDLVTFRKTKYHYGTTAGCTLGHEAAALTTDFAFMSFGDSTARNLLEAVDPNVHHSWIDDEGHINYTQIAKNVVSSTFKSLTYNAGEDIAVAIPYAFYGKVQRSFLDHMWKGYRYDADRRLNGASFRVNDHGDVIGTYNAAGALDLQGRFTVYNIGTLMYREAYVNIGNALKNWYEAGFKLPHAPTSMGELISDSVEAAGGLSRWAVRDAIKATLYMTPAVPAFWMFRVPQTKYHGAYIHPEKGLISFGEAPLKIQVVHANEVSRTSNKLRPAETKFSNETNTRFIATGDNYKGVENGPVVNPFSKYGEYSTEDGLMRIDAYKHKYTWFEELLNPLGKVNDKVRRAAHAPVKWLEEVKGTNIDEKFRAKNFTDTFVNASFAYTPYFMMKNDVMAYNWDTAKMDMAIERFVDGATQLSGKEMKEGLGEIWASMQTWKAPHGMPFKDPEREVAAQKAICDDESPPDGQNFYANTRCFDNAVRDIITNSKYHQNVDTKRFVERLEDSKKRSKGMLDQFRQEVTDSFASMVRPAGAEQQAWQKPDPELSYASKERHRKAQSLDDFPTIGTTMH